MFSNNKNPSKPANPLNASPVSQEQGEDENLNFFSAFGPDASKFQYTEPVNVLKKDRLEKLAIVMEASHKAVQEAITDAVEVIKESKRLSKALDRPEEDRFLSSQDGIDKRHASSASRFFVVEPESNPTSPITDAEDGPDHEPSKDELDKPHKRRKTELSFVEPKSNPASPKTAAKDDLYHKSEGRLNTLHGYSKSRFPVFKPESDSTSDNSPKETQKSSPEMKRF